MTCTLREVQWRLNKIRQRTDARIKVEAAMHGLQLPGDFGMDYADEKQIELSPAMEEKIQAQLVETQERLKQRFQVR